MADITMPKMGFDMTEGTIVRWLKQVGEEIKKGEPIAEIETDKVTIEIEAFESGTLSELVANEGDLVPVGDVIARLGGNGAPAGGAPASGPGAHGGGAPGSAGDGPAGGSSAAGGAPDGAGSASPGSAGAGTPGSSGAAGSAK